MNNKECWKCGTTLNLHKHHIFGAANRKRSEKYKLYVYLCARHHNMSNEGVHFDKAFDMVLKQEYQKAFEELYGHELFMQEFQRNYLEVG